MDVYFYEAFAEETELLQKLMPAGIVAEYTDGTIQEAGHTAPPARLISTRTQSILPIAWAPQIDAILSRSTGFDHLAAYASQIAAPVQFGYLPLYCHRAVAEQAMMLWMALLRRLPQQIRQFHGFHRDGLTGFEAAGRTLAVVGVGNIGHEICDVGRALRMSVLGVDRDERHADVNYASLDDALAAADIVVCALDLNATTRGFFTADVWRRAKRKPLFINISRGECSESTALIAALDAGQLSGVALDVYDHEAELAVALRGARDAPVALDAKPALGAAPVRPAATTDPEARAALELSRRDNCICTPHNAFNSFEGVERKSMHSIQQIVALRETGRFLWPATFA